MPVIFIVESLLPVKDKKEYDSMKITGIGSSCSKMCSRHVPDIACTNPDGQVQPDYNL